MDRILERRLASLDYYDPEHLLQEVLPAVEIILQKPELAGKFSSKEKKALLEKYQAAFLGFMMKRAMQRIGSVSISVHESDDFDCIMKAEIQGGEVACKPVQLKQLPSRQANPRTEIQKEIDKLQKYGACSTLVVAFWINRDTKLDMTEVRFDHLSIEQLWFFGDSPRGPITLHGGTIADLCSGICWFSRMEHGLVTTRPWRFRRKEGRA